MGEPAEEPTMTVSSLLMALHESALLHLVSGTGLGSHRGWRLNWIYTTPMFGSVQCDVRPARVPPVILHEKCK